ncbi:MULTISPECIES: catechol 2,3-dioxygenase [Pseudomonas]|jgi:catechol 2,3-dioxygenase|uniref:Metapyrocatechase n=12 Tax=Pseudomonas TaxID=286 RepID=Q5EFP3_PSEFL|nr:MULTISPECIES: catechol 2,3-dioxygenase [Pseudomonas]AAO39661.1 catechol 2,3-dioxygenase [Pseudomonas sp. A2YC1]ABR10831.1 catechol 2,3-dioxygenase [Pseudomonas sp. ND2-24]AAO64305.1 catechol 2,3-dioxygenase [Pseudomonas putida]AAP44220.1 catechol 2,3-dioxygenase [Pseudomonas putida ND6]AAW81680.2 catechol 2,3-dioxygenase [Pseudomonas fluorescens]
MKKGVMRPGHVQLRVLDMGKALEHYIELLGLIEMDRDDQGRVYLKAWSEVDKFSVVLREADEPGMDFMGFKVVDEVSLQQLEQDLQAHGCSVEQVPAGELNSCGRRVRFQAPSGHHFELYADKEYTGKWGVNEVNPEAWPRDLKGMSAVRFDHCLLYGDELQATYELFTEVLGFYLAEQVVDAEGIRLAQFLSLSTKAHDVAFIQHAEKGKFHHASFLLDTWEDVLRAADLISMTDTSIDIGPTRHGLTHGKTIYFFDPSGNRCEVFCGGNYNYPDHKPVTWLAKDVGKAIFYHDRVLNERFMTVMT